jgi:hypothetical protein
MDFKVDPEGIFLMALGLNFLKGIRLPRFLRAKPKEPESSKDDSLYITKLKEKHNRLLQAYQNQHQVNAHLNKVNQQLKERADLLNNFIHQGAYLQQGRQQEQIAQEMDSFGQDLTPLVEGIEKGDLSGLSSDYMSNIQKRSKGIKGGIVKMLESLRRQKEELQVKLNQQDKELLQKQTEIERLSALTRDMQTEEGAAEILALAGDKLPLIDADHTLLVERQQKSIDSLKENNLRLQEQNRMFTNFFQQGTWRQYEAKQELTIASLSELKHDVSQVIKNDKSVPKELTSSILTVLEARSRNLEDQLRGWRSETNIQRQEMLSLLEKKEFLLLRQLVTDDIGKGDQHWQEELKKLRQENTFLKEEQKINQTLQKKLSESENNLKNLIKKYQALQTQWEVAATYKGFAEENAVLKKTLALFREKLKEANQQIAALKLEYEKLLAEYELMFQGME